MLKRREKLQKYIKTLKNKQIKKSNQNLKQHTVLKHKIDVNSVIGIDADDLKKEDQRNQQILEVENDANLQLENGQGEGQGEGDKPCWYDPDDDQEQDKVVLQGRNKFKKIGKFGAQREIQVEEYQKKLGKFYQARYKRVNWAQQADQIQQKDVNDYLNQQIYFSSKKPSKKTIKFHSKTSQPHQSIITGLCWHNHILFSCGLDHKLKIHHFSPSQTNPDLKLTQQKDIYIKDLPLSNCHYKKQQNQLLMGTLRKNIVKVDTEKWMPEFITSAFFKEFKTYENLRLQKNGGGLCLFSANGVGFLDRNFVYAGALKANQKIQDVCFGGDWGMYGVTSQAFYEWDTRKMQIVRMQKKYLNYTTIQTTPRTLILGSKLGTLYLHPESMQSGSSVLSPALQNTTLLTDISHLSSNEQGSLCIGLSKWKSNAIRVIDTMTSKSIGNWPSAKTKVGIPMKSAFGVGDYFAVGNANGGVGVYGVQSQIL